MFFFQEGFTYRNFLLDVFTIFIFIMWFWLLISITRDLFRRHDISGWGKAIWIIVLILIPYIGVFAYLISQGRGMAERNMQQAQQAREQVRRVVGFSAADEIEKLDRLKKQGRSATPNLRVFAPIFFSNREAVHAIVPGQDDAYRRHQFDDDRNGQEGKSSREET